MPQDKPSRLRDADVTTLQSALTKAAVNLEGHALDLVQRIEAEHGMMPSVEDLAKIKALMDARSAIVNLREMASRRADA